MPREIRPIRCFHGRVTGEPCEEPATREVLGPCPHLLCEEHALELMEDSLEIDWIENDGPQKHARACEEAANDLDRWMSDPRTGPLTAYVLEGALTYLELYELPRARAALVWLEGGQPKPTERELADLRFFEWCADRWGWTDTPRWVTRLRRWKRET